MPPFSSPPEGFSSESLELLDQALTKMWMAQLKRDAASLGDTGSEPSQLGPAPLQALPRRSR